MSRTPGWLAVYAGVYGLNLLGFILNAFAGKPVLAAVCAAWTLFYAYQVHATVKALRGGK